VEDIDNGEILSHDGEMGSVTIPLGEVGIRKLRISMGTLRFVLYV
jgi:hypothetical protein